MRCDAMEVRRRSGCGLLLLESGESERRSERANTRCNALVGRGEQRLYTEKRADMRLQNEHESTCSRRKLHTLNNARV